jgi:zeaxanthin glucosyltransferase
VLPWSYDPSPKGIRRNAGGYRVARIVERPITKVIRDHAARLGRSDIRFADETWSHLAQITQCVRGLDFPREQLPESFHYVGPLRELEAAPDFDLPDNRRPLIFCSLGTLQGSRSSIFRAIAKATKDLNVDLLIAHGGMLPQHEVERLPGAPMVHSFVPQRAVLERASLAITHCGFNTVMDALGAGVPMVGLPITFEQPATGARLRRVGVAEILQRRRTVGRIRHAVEQVLSDRSYRDSAVRLSKEIAASGGVRRAADIIETATGGAPQGAATRERGARGDVRGDSRSGSS